MLRQFFIIVLIPFSNQIQITDYENWYTALLNQPGKILIFVRYILPGNFYSYNFGTF